MLDACLRVVVLARTPEHLDMTVSGSHPELGGLAGPINLHSEKWGTEQVVDALVHEAIHALIAKKDSPMDSFQRTARLTALQPSPPGPAGGSRCGRSCTPVSCGSACGITWKRASSHSARAQLHGTRARASRVNRFCATSRPREWRSSSRTCSKRSGRWPKRRIPRTETPERARTGGVTVPVRTCLPTVNHSVLDLAPVSI